MAAPFHLNQLTLPSLRFLKTSKQIQLALAGRIAESETKRQALRSQIEAICKVREIPPEEIYEAGDDEEAISTYSMKMSGSYKQAPRSIVEALQADIETLARLGREHAKRLNGIAELSRVAVNFENPDRTFDLSYLELATLGF